VSGCVWIAEASGRKNHFAADREVAEKPLASVPSGRVGAREQRGFLGRVVRYLALEAGIRQFLDIGTGLPTTDNVHEIAQAVAPSSRVVYVDNDRCKSGCAHRRWASQLTGCCPVSPATPRVGIAVWS
jgi:hypothetical protein